MLCHPVFLPGDELVHACDQLEDCQRRKVQSESAESSLAEGFTEHDGFAMLDGIEPQRKRTPGGSEVAAPLFALTYTEKSKYGMKLWPKGKTIKVFFINSHEKRGQVLAIASEWSRHCSIRFSEVSDRSQSEVRVSFDENAGSHSMIGTDALRVGKGERTLNLAVVDNSTVLHEFGHVLGLLHEHQSPIKGIVRWNTQKVFENFRGPPNFWTDDQIESQILDRYETDGVTGSTYDMRSIMHYSFAKELILSIDGRPPLASDIPVIEELSPTDKLVVEKLYGPPGTKPAPPREEPGASTGTESDSKSVIKPGEEMRFTFTSDPTEVRKYTIETTGSAADLALSLFGPGSDDKFIAAATDGGEDGNPRVVQHLLPGKTYYVVVRAFANGGAFGLKISTVVRRFATYRPI